MERTERLYFKKTRHNPYPKNDQPIIRSAVGTITHRKNILVCNEDGKTEYCDGYVVSVMERCSAWGESSDWVKLLTIDEAKAWLEKRYGGKWKYSESVII